MKRTAPELPESHIKPEPQEYPTAVTCLDNITFDVLLCIIDMCTTQESMQLIRCSTHLHSLRSAVLRYKELEIMSLASDIARHHVLERLGSHDAEAWLRDGGLVAGGFTLAAVMIAMDRVDHGLDEYTLMENECKPAFEALADLLPYEDIDMVLPYHETRRNALLAATENRLLFWNFENQYVKAPEAEKEVWTNYNDVKFDLVRCTLSTVGLEPRATLDCVWLDKGQKPANWIRQAYDLTCCCFMMDSKFKISNPFPGELERIRNHTTRIIRTDLTIHRIEKYLRKGFRIFEHPYRHAAEFHVQMIETR